jgi:hypothetical protein
MASHRPQRSSWRIPFMLSSSRRCPRTMKWSAIWAKAPCGRRSLSHVEQSWPRCGTWHPSTDEHLRLDRLLKPPLQGSRYLLGKAVIEASMSDAQSRKVFRAGVDRRVCTKNLTRIGLIQGRTAMNDYSTGRNGRYQLSIARQLINCPKPRA